MEHLVSFRAATGEREGNGQCKCTGEMQRMHGADVGAGSWELCALLVIVYIVQVLPAPRVLGLECTHFFTLSPYYFPSASPVPAANAYPSSLIIRFTADKARTSASTS